MEALFVFNRKIGSTDEAATVSERTEKLLFYSSTCGDALEEQLERLSMCEAFIDLCRSFDADDPCEAVFLDNHAYAMLECEPDTWIVVCCRTRLGDMKEDELVGLTSSSFATYLYRSPAVASSSKRSPIGKLPFRRNVSNASMRRRASKSHPSHGDSNVSDSRIVETADPSVHVLRALLDRMYKLFLLYHGTIQGLLWPEHVQEDIPMRLKTLRKILRKTRQLQELVDEGDLNPDPEQEKLLREREDNEDSLASMLAQSTADKAREMLASFLPAFLSQVDFTRLHLLYEDCALPFATVEKDVMVSVQLLMDRLQGTFPSSVQSCALLHAGEIVWSSLPMDMLRSMHALLDIILCERAESPHSASDGSNGRSRIQDGRLASANGDEGAIAASLADRHAYPLSPGFLRMGSASESNEHSRPEDTTELYFPALFNSSEGVFQRVAVYGMDRMIALVLLPSTDPKNATEWSTPQLLELAGNLEGFLHSELSTLVCVLGRGRTFLSTMSATSTTGEPEEQYLYINEGSSVVSIADAWLSKVQGPGAGAFPSNHDLGLLFTSNLLTAINNARREFSTEATERMLIIQFVRPNSYQQQSSCWLASIKSGTRQVYLMVDPKHSFEYVNQRARALREGALHSILL
ncbi:Vacuolar fusion protein CCZ1-like [Hondaea fermentalgiana]|uniref:Vacuolar fusion protein CCZ1-like n=1 Tax=Hondaea fermentalgiana TaxID=2315210 RepID=A0A2R5GKA0_9STRA|nr:Vacuolar fusion protein CCZ1-like [Hondaea fermentalgiana]|eukprot:GBG30749.1 Vacuolar fusion protein CCZ1-like [Hondaea fermentalgiana]